MSQVAVVRAVVVVKGAKKRIPEKLLGRVTFFGDFDLWEYHLDPSLAGRHCEICEEYRDLDVFIGQKIRWRFPYLEIVDENKITVNEHPNCGCWLKRIGIDFDFLPKVGRV